MHSLHAVNEMNTLCGLCVHLSVCIFNFWKCCLNCEEILYSGPYQNFATCKFTAAYHSVVIVTLNEHQNYCARGNLCIPSDNISTLFTHLFCGLDVMSIDLVKMVLENVCLLMTTHTREIVGSALSFVQMFLTSFSYDVVAPEVSHIVSILTFSGNNTSFDKWGKFLNIAFEYY
jgi:hypothetical protein